MRNGKKKSLVGDPINFRGMANAPVNEAGVVALFSMVARDLGYYVQEIGSDFPDAILRRESAGEYGVTSTLDDGLRRGGQRPLGDDA